MMTSVIRRPIGKAAGERLVASQASAGPFISDWLPPGGCPASIVPARGQKPAGLPGKGRCMGSVRVLAGAGKEGERRAQLLTSIPSRRVSAVS